VRKLLLLGLVLSLTVFALDQAEAGVKAGDKCQKVSATQIVGKIKFTCIKSGSKLVWNKGVAIITASKPSPSSSVSATPIVQTKPNPFDTSPFPDEFNRTEMVEALFNSFNEFIKRPPSNNSYKLIIDPKFQSDAPAITKLVKDTYATLPFPLGYPTTVVVISDDKELIEKTVKENGFGKGNYQESGYYCRNCAGQGWATSSNPLSWVTVHEMFHIWQKAAYQRPDDNNPDPNNSANPPVWFDEGGADFFSEAFYSKVSGNYQVPKLRWEPLNLKDYISRDKDRSLPYILGRLAGEYIVASKGMDKYLEIYWNVGKGQGFTAAFENALGISLNSFYEKFDKNLKNML
jgi:hypothetical protein